MTDELKQLAAQFCKENISLYPAHGSGFVEVVKSNFEKNLDELLREVQRQTVEAAERGEPAAEPQPEKGWLKPILEQARADINARPAWQKSRVVPAAPAPAARKEGNDESTK